MFIQRDKLQPNTFSWWRIAVYSFRVILHCEQRKNTVFMRMKKDDLSALGIRLV